ncbi:MAG: hypothetical protein ACKPCM_09200 [Pseudanabaena sp.]
MKSKIKSCKHHPNLYRRSCTGNINCGTAKKCLIPVTLAEQKAIETLVQKCLEAKGQNVSQWEQEIDEIVARLYGLSE